MVTENDLSWSQITQWRRECFERFGTILDMTVVVSPSSKLQELLEPGRRILDIGAGVQKPMKSVISGDERTYFSLDVDTNGDFDFHSFADIPESQQFDLMWSNQVLEHVSIQEAFSIVKSGYQHLADGGYFLATVPNPAHPSRHWADVTHIQHWPFNDLYGLFREIGFEVTLLARYNKQAFPQGFVKRMVTNIVCEVFRVDWCDSLLIVGQKQPKGN